MKRAIVTGGAGLIGQEICSALLNEGWEVASFDLKEGTVGQQVHCDLASEESVSDAFRTLGWNQLDLLVNNGGLVYDTFMQLGDTSLGQWNSTIGEPSDRCLPHVASRLALAQCWQLDCHDGIHSRAYVGRRRLCLCRCEGRHGGTSLRRWLCN